MIQPRALSKTTRAGGALLTAVASSLAAVAVVGTGTANATCLSISGLNNGGGCTSTAGSIAIAIGTNATASAKGFLNSSLAIGTNSTALTNGNLNTAVAMGTYSNAYGGIDKHDTANVAINIANNSSNLPYGAVASSTAGHEPSFGNIAINLGRDNSVGAFNGALNTAVNVGGTKNSVLAQGTVNRARQFGGSNNIVWASGDRGFSRAFNYFGSNNQVFAGDPVNPSNSGPVAIAGAIGVSNHNGGTAIKKQRFGIKVKTPLNP